MNISIASISAIATLCFLVSSSIAVTYATVTVNKAEIQNLKTQEKEEKNNRIRAEKNLSERIDSIGMKVDWLYRNAGGE